jgi:hypothetical protein
MWGACVCRLLALSSSKAERHQLPSRRHIFDASFPRTKAAREERSWRRKFRRACAFRSKYKIHHTHTHSLTPTTLSPHYLFTLRTRYKHNFLCVKCIKTRSQMRLRVCEGENASADQNNRFLWLLVLSESECATGSWVVCFFHPLVKWVNAYFYKLQSGQRPIPGAAMKSVQEAGCARSERTFLRLDPVNVTLLLISD